MKNAFRCLLVCFAAAITLSVSAQSVKITDAEALLEQAIAYHDPDGNWNDFAGEFMVVSTRPGKSSRHSLVRMDHPRSYFRIEINLDGIDTALELQGESCRLEYQGQTDFSESIAEKHRLNCERARMWRNYYSYLYGLPMKLRDEGTRLDPEVKAKVFKGKKYQVLKVTYDEAVGGDTWYFYFDPETHAMQVYQFYHDESKNDGEYILLEEEVLLNGMRIPRKRSWYTNAEDKFLGADILLEAGGSKE